MKITDISNNINEWFSGAGPHCDAVISSRIRLARNLDGHKFLSRCSDNEKTEILNLLKNVTMSLQIGDNVSYVSVDEASSLDRNLLMERHLISRGHALGKGPRGVVLAHREFFAAMINEEDHLRLQVLKPGFQLNGCYEQINSIDDRIEKQIAYAFSTKYGYLTACPTNLGTGIRISVMLHLPALKMTGQIKKFLNAARAMNLAVRGLFGEGSEAAGDFYQLSNQVSLGISEMEIIKQFEATLVPEIIDYERQARQKLLEDNSQSLDDKVSRALALLRNAHLISSQEALTLLSHIRLGINMREHMGAETPALKSLCGLIPRNVARSEFIQTINRLFMLTQPAHLQINHGRHLDPTKRDALRAKIIRSELGGESRQ